MVHIHNGHAKTPHHGGAEGQPEQAERDNGHAEKQKPHDRIPPDPANLTPNDRKQSWREAVHA